MSSESVVVSNAVSDVPSPFVSIVPFAEPMEEVPFDMDTDLGTTEEDVRSFDHEHDLDDHESDEPFDQNQELDQELEPEQKSTELLLSLSTITQLSKVPSDQVAFPCITRKMEAKMESVPTTEEHDEKEAVASEPVDLIMEDVSHADVYPSVDVTTSLVTDASPTLDVATPLVNEVTETTVVDTAPELQIDDEDLSDVEDFETQVQEAVPQAEQNQELEDQKQKQELDQDLTATDEKPDTKEPLNEEQSEESFEEQFDEPGEQHHDENREEKVPQVQNLNVIPVWSSKVTSQDFESLNAPSNSVLTTKVVILGLLWVAVLWFVFGSSVSQPQPIFVPV